FLFLVPICHGQNPKSEVKTPISGAPQSMSSAQKPPSAPAKNQSKRNSAKDGKSDTADKQQPKAADKDLPKALPSVVKCAIYSNNGQAEPSDLSRLRDLCPDSLSSQVKNIPNAALGSDLF